MLKRFATVLLLATLCLPSPAQAEDRGFSAMAVQNRHHVGTHEFGVGFGVLPMDAFTKGVTVNAAYTLHFTEALAWEVANFVYSFHADTDLKSDLAAFELRPTPFEVLNYHLTTNIVFKPVYWKGALLNGALVRGEFFFVAGGGYGWFTRSGRPALDAGAGVRVYGSKHFSLRLDTRYLAFMHDQAGSIDVTHEIWIGLGVALVL
jgi:outer membrane beta-barrel protein